MALGLGIVAGVLKPQAVSAQAKPAWDTPVPAEFQESWKAFLQMKAKAAKPAAPLPDWSGIWTALGGIQFDPAQPGGPGSAGKTSASLTPAYEARFRTKMANVAKGIEWDPLSSCLPAGFPRWLTEPLPALGGSRPADLMDTMEGQSLVAAALAKIQSGAYA